MNEYYIYYRRVNLILINIRVMIFNFLFQTFIYG